MERASEYSSTLSPTSPLLARLAVERLVVDEIGVVVLEDGGEGHAARLPVLHRVGPDPVESHHRTGV